MTYRYDRRQPNVAPSTSPDAVSRVQVPVGPGLGWDQGVKSVARVFFFLDQRVLMASVQFLPGLSECLFILHYFTRWRFTLFLPDGAIYNSSRYWSSLSELQLYFLLEK